MTKILYENGPFWVCAAEFGSGRFKPKSKGFEVYENGVTHATRRAVIGRLVARAILGDRPAVGAIFEPERLVGDTAAA